MTITSDIVVFMIDFMIDHFIVADYVFDVIGMAGSHGSHVEINGTTGLPLEFPCR